MKATDKEEVAKHEAAKSKVKAETKKTDVLKKETKKELKKASKIRVTPKADKPTKADAEISAPGPKVAVPAANSVEEEATPKPKVEEEPAAPEAKKAPEAEEKNPEAEKAPEEKKAPVKVNKKSLSELHSSYRRRNGLASKF